MLVLDALFVLRSANAYELATHGAITQKAYESSLLMQDQQLLKDIGIEDGVNAFGRRYYDVSGVVVNERKQNLFENKIIKGDLGVEELSIAGWLMRGAIREDDHKDLALCNYYAPNPKDDPYLENRPLNHFFDPINNAKLNGPFWEHASYKAPDWALGFIDPFTTMPAEDTNRRNHFTVVDAREALYRALTSRNKAGDVVAATEGERKAYWATTFRALGDVVHLVEDMAQPQHTRLDKHSGICSAVLTGHSSVYEKYIDARATGTASYTIDGTPIAPAPLPYGGYPIPEFDDYASFFSTRHLDGTDPVQRRGLADYSNRGFFTAGTNLGTNNFDLPSNSAGDYKAQDTSVLFPEAIPETVRLLTGDVPDTAQPARTALNVPLTTEGMWEQFLEENVAVLPKYTLTRPNYDAMAEQLIPRAVAYSAGLLNYFFRGRLDLDIQAYNRSDVSIRFTNRTKNDTMYSDSGAGQLVMSYRYKDASDQWVFGASEEVVPLSPGDDVPSAATSAQTYSFTFDPPIPSEAADLELRLIFRGRLGNEADAVAVGYEPMTSGGFFVTPSVTPADGITGSRRIYKVDGEWRIAPGSGFAFGELDWKGHSADDVISFDGPVNRYIYRNGSGYSPYIYRKGVYWAIVPQGNVLGAGIRGHGTARELIAITYSPYTLRVYMRDYAATYPNQSDYNATTNPFGWRLVFEEGVSDAYPATPVFLNASGTEAKGIFDEWSGSGTRIATFSFGAGTASLSYTYQTGAATQTKTTRNSANSTVTATPGYVDHETCVTGTECVERACPDNPNTCTRAEEQSTYTYGSSQFQYQNIPASEPVAMAVDYQGDQAILATIRYGQDYDLLDKTVNTQSNTQRANVWSCAGSLTLSGTIETTQEYVLRSASSKNFSLSFSQTTIPLQTDYRENDQSERRTHVFDIATSSTTTNQATITNTSRRTLINGKFNFLDLRHNITAYAVREETTSDIVNGSGGVGSVSGGDALTADRTTDIRDTLRTIVKLGNNEFVLHESTVDAPFSGPYTHRLETIHGECVHNANTESQTQTTLTSDWTGFLYYLHPKISNSESGQGYAVDSDGNVVISQTIWAESQTSIGTFDTVGTWNYLGGGDLATLFGITNPNVKFWPVGVY